MSEQEQEALAYIEAAVGAGKRRLALLEDAYKRGVHKEDEYEWLRRAIIREQEEAWEISLDDLL